MNVFNVTGQAFRWRVLAGARLFLFGGGMKVDDPGVGLEVESRVIEVLSDYFPARRGKIGVDSRLVEDLCMDSIGLVEIVMALNEMFAIELPDAGVEEWKTVRDICGFVEQASGLSEAG